MNTLKKFSSTHKIAWTLAATILILVALAALISAVNQPAQSTQDLKPNSLESTPASQATPLQPDCQAQPDCGYIRAHAVDQSMLGSGPAGQVNSPVLTPACDALAECGYIRAHIQADAGTQP